MKNKQGEIIYDEQISPLVAQILKICKENNIPHFMSFEYDKGDFCTSSNPFDGHGIFAHYNVLKECIRTEGIHVDKYILWLLRQPNTSSMCLSQLGNKPDTTMALTTQKTTQQ